MNVFIVEAVLYVLQVLIFRDVILYFLDMYERQLSPAEAISGGIRVGVVMGCLLYAYIGRYLIH
jgi:hypothetical protein